MQSGGTHFATMDFPVLVGCHWLKMLWIDARRIFAQVMKLMSFRNRPDKSLVHDSMSKPLTDSSVPVF